MRPSVAKTVLLSVFMKLCDTFDLYMNYVQSYASRDTILYYDNCLKVFKQFLFFTDFNTNINVSKINKNILVDFVVYLRSLDISNTSVRTYVRGVKAYFRYLYFEGYILTDITQHLKLPKADNSQKIPLSYYQVQILDEFLIEKERFKDFCIIHLMLDCGLRLQEVVALNVSDIRYDYGVKRGFVSVINSKGNKSRLVPLPAFLYRYIQQYISSNSIKIILFPSCNGRISPSGIKTMFCRLKTVVPGIHAHLLRHTFATNFIMGGGNLENLRVLLGHSSYAVTQNYIKLATELSLVDYNIYKIDDIYFNSYDYHKR